MKPSQLYQQDIEANRVEADTKQEIVLQVFDALYDELLRPSKPFWPFTKRANIKGVYLYGPVGRGKTYLMDVFYQSIVLPKLRVHFYEFMADVHVQLKMLQGQINPLHQVVEKIAKQAKVLCLDEFFVEDIADAMILASLLDGLFKAEVVVVTTSNTLPANLYQDGLQRDRFIPATHLIETHMQVINLDHPTDYRQIHDFKSKNYHFPLSGQQEFLNFHFKQLAAGQPMLDKQFTLHDWGFIAIERTAKVLWIDFQELCAKPRAAQDYLSLTETYGAILLQNVPILEDKNNDAVRRFITLVDTCYDRHVPLIMGAAVPLAELYQGKALAFEFQRTQSRLIEMAGWV